MGLPIKEMCLFSDQTCKISFFKGRNKCSAEGNHVTFVQHEIYVEKWARCWCLLKADHERECIEHNHFFMPPKKTFINK